jgi:hypothetical protein
MSDPVRDTRQAVDAARSRLWSWIGTPSNGRVRADFADDLDIYAAAVEAWVLARERRETLARGGDATEARP